MSQTTHTNKTTHTYQQQTHIHVHAHTCMPTYLYTKPPHTSIHILKYIEYENNSHGTEEETSEMSLVYIHVYTLKTDCSHINYYRR